MPYYHWRGVDLSASIKKGTQFARSETELDAQLLQRDIALLSCKPARIWLVRSIPLSCQIDLFTHLALLLQAGVHLPKALRLVSDRLSHKHATLIMQEVADMVEEGVAFADAMAKFGSVFNSTIITMIAIGMETGNIESTLTLIAHHLSTRQAFIKRIRSALALPIITLVFFAMVAVVLLVVVIPRFAQLMGSMHRQLPTSVRWLLNMSMRLQSWYGPALLVGMVIVVLIIIRAMMSAQGKKILVCIALRVPFIGDIIINSALGTYFQGLSALLAGGMPLAPALQLACMSIAHEPIRDRLNTVAQAVTTGYLPSQAYATHVPDLVMPDINAMILIGDEAGSLRPLCARAAQVYQHQVERKLGIITTILQPLLLVILGCLVMGLIVALYTPIFNLSYLM